MKHYPLFKAELIDGKWYALNIETKRKHFVISQNDKIEDGMYIEFKKNVGAVIKIQSDGSLKFYFPYKDEEGNILNICELYDNHILVRNTGLGYIDYDYNVLVPPEYRHLDILFWRSRREDEIYPNLLKAFKDDKMYVVDPTKKVEIFGPYTYTSIVYDENDWRHHFMVGTTEVQGKEKYEIISLKDWEKIHFDYVDSYVLFEKEHIIAYKQSDKWFIYEVNKFGSLIRTFKCNYQAKPVFTDGFIIMKSYGKYGVINMQEQTIIPFIYDKIYDYLIMKENNCYLSNEGNLVREYDVKRREECEEERWGRYKTRPIEYTEHQSEVIETNNFKVKESKLIGRWLCILKE